MLERVQALHQPIALLLLRGKPISAGDCAAWVNDSPLARRWAGLPFPSASSGPKKQSSETVASKRNANRLRGAVVHVCRLLPIVAWF